MFNIEDFKKEHAEEVSKLNYKKYFYQFTEEEKRKLAKELKDIEVYFQAAFNLVTYPVYGTLLGIMRDNDFIAQDTDIDLAYLSNYHTEEEVLKEWHEICNRLDKVGMLLWKCKTASHMHVISPNKGLRMDMWISWIDENGKYYLVWTVDGEIEQEMIVPFKTIEFKGQVFNQMNDPIRFLDEHYKDWKTPIPGEAKDWAKRTFKFRLEQWKGS